MPHFGSLDALGCGVSLFAPYKIDVELNIARVSSISHVQCWWMMISKWLMLLTARLLLNMFQVFQGCNMLVLLLTFFWPSLTDLVELTVCTLGVSRAPRGGWWMVDGFVSNSPFFALRITPLRRYYRMAMVCWRSAAKWPAQRQEVVPCVSPWEILRRCFKKEQTCMSDRAIIQVTEGDVRFADVRCLAVFSLSVYNRFQ